jgi:class 3 adenylate cyclase
MLSIVPSPLANVEHRLRYLLPADLYAEAWVDPSAQNLVRVVEHLRTLQRVLLNYVPRHLGQSAPPPGEVRYQWQEGTLLFTDLAGFTPLMEANSHYGRQGAESLLSLLNHYFATMLEIISKSGGDLLEFTGDALLVQFDTGRRGQDVGRAVRTGFRMQQAMQEFSHIETAHGTLSLGMRVGIHTGRFLTADIGNPFRMEHVLMGSTVQRTKRAEGAGSTGRVSLTPEAYQRLGDDPYPYEHGREGHFLLLPKLDEDVDDYEITVFKRSSKVLSIERSTDGLSDDISDIVSRVDALASYLPTAVLKLIVENAARRQIPPDFASPTILFINLAGIPQAADEAAEGEEKELVAAFSRLFALINAAVESRGGVLKRVTYHLYGSDMMVVFGVPLSHTDDPQRAASAALAIREIITHSPPVMVGGRLVDVHCQIGMALGAVFAAEIGDRRGRREFNVLGDAVNTAARLMGKADPNTILVTETLYQAIQPQFHCDFLGEIQLKGKQASTPLYSLLSAVEAF